MTTDNIRSRVRKLLALAGDGGATDNERAVAMQKAQALIKEHNIQLGSLDDFAEQIKIVKGEMFVHNLKHPYHRVLARGVARLYECQNMVYQKVGGFSYWGLNHQVEAAEEAFLWIVAQVEELYRVALKAFDGQLSKQQRAELRASFKDACAVRVAQRIDMIMSERRETRDSRALVVVDTTAAKLAEAMSGMKQAKAVALRDGFGTGAGYRAGDQVQIQKGVRA